MTSAISAVSRHESAAITIQRAWRGRVFVKKHFRPDGQGYYACPDSNNLFGALFASQHGYAAIERIKQCDSRELAEGKFDGVVKRCLFRASFLEKSQGRRLLRLLAYALFSGERFDPGLFPLHGLDGGLMAFLADEESSNKSIVQVLHILFEQKKPDFKRLWEDRVEPLLPKGKRFLLHSSL
jgi:hypothetical protein